MLPATILASFAYFWCMKHNIYEASCCSCSQWRRAFWARDHYAMCV